MADPTQLDAFVADLLAEGLLDEQFSQLMQLQDDTNPHFVAEVGLPHYSLCAGSGRGTRMRRPADQSSPRRWAAKMPRAAGLGATLAIMYQPASGSGANPSDLQHICSRLTATAISESHCEQRHSRRLTSSSFCDAQGMYTLRILRP